MVDDLDARINYQQMKDSIAILGKALPGINMTKNVFKMYSICIQFKYDTFRKNTPHARIGPRELT